MRHFTFLIFCSFFLTSNTSAQSIFHYSFFFEQAKHTKNDNRADGPVKSILLESFEYEAGKKGKAARANRYEKKFFKTFNPAGEVTEFKTFHENGIDVDNSQIYSYNQTGKLTSILLHDVDKDIKKTIEVIYDDNGVETARAVYDEAGNQIAMNTMKEKDGITTSTGDTQFGLDYHTTKDETDPKKVVVTTKAEKPTHPPIIEKIKDDNGNVVKEIWKMGKDKIHTIHVKTYDGNGNELSSEQRDAQGNLWDSHVFKYDDNNNRTLFAKYKKGALQSQISFEFDENNNVTSSHTIIPTQDVDEKRSYKYTYDKFQNWNKRVTFFEDEATHITERTIKYY